MSTCPQCAQLLSADADHCPACGHDLHARRLQPDEIADKDPEQDRDELLTAAIATEGTAKPPPPWVPSVEERLKPLAGDHDEEVRDVVPADVPFKKPPFWRRLVSR